MYKIQKHVKRWLYTRLTFNLCMYIVVEELFCGHSISCDHYFLTSSFLLAFQQSAKGWQKPLLATPAEGAPYSGVTFVPGPMPPGVGGPLLSYIHPVEGMPPLALMDPTMMMGNLEELGHFHGGLFIPHVPPEGQRMMMPMQGDSPQHVQPLMYQPKQRSHAIPIVAPQANQKVCTVQQ